MTLHRTRQLAVALADGAKPTPALYASLAESGSGVARKAVLYARVSSKEQELGYSIAAQQELLRRYGSEQNLTIEEFSDVETAKTVGRPGFNAMLSYLGRHRDCRVVLVEKTDRLYRNFRDVVTLDEADLEIHFVKQNSILTKESRSSEKFMHGLNVLMAKNYIDNLSEEVKKGVRTKAAQGLWPSYAPLGYLNTVRADGKRIVVPDPVLGPIVTQLFEWFAKGEYSLKALAKTAYQEGFRFRKSQGKVPVTTLHKILRKRIYTGDFDYGGRTYEGSREPLVRREVWDRVQEILDGRHARKHRKVTHDFVYSGSAADTAGAPWWVKSRRAGMCTTTARDTAESVQSRIRAKKSWSNSLQPFCAIWWSLLRFSRGCSRNWSSPIKPSRLLGRKRCGVSRWNWNGFRPGWRCVR